MGAQIYGVCRTISNRDGYSYTSRLSTECSWYNAAGVVEKPMTRAAREDDSDGDDGDDTAATYSVLLSAADVCLLLCC